MGVRISSLFMWFIFCVCYSEKKTSNVVWTKNKISVERPEWAGVVTADITGTKVKSVGGVVVPFSTRGRPSAPLPLNGCDVGKELSLDRGHVFALSNGGVDENWNIVPQPSTWQQTQGWRKVETAIYYYAKAQYGITKLYTSKNVSSMPQPDTLVNFHVDILTYDRKSCIPQTYKGYVTNGVNKYVFTIKVNEDAVWTPIIPPKTAPSHSTRILGSNDTIITTKGVTTKVYVTATKNVTGTKNVTTPIPTSIKNGIQEKTREVVKFVKNNLYFTLFIVVASLFVLENMLICFCWTCGCCCFAEKKSAGGMSLANDYDMI